MLKRLYPNLVCRSFIREISNCTHYVTCELQEGSGGGEAGYRRTQQVEGRVHVQWAGLGRCMYVMVSDTLTVVLYCAL